MARKKLLLFLKFAFLSSLLLISAEPEEKSSLTFVIDDTGSMADDIEAVKRGANAIFDTVLNSNVSQIEDFILVTFNDPTYKHRITTRDRDDFKSALADIDVDGGGDCPEMSLTGIELGLQKSKPGSLLYVFTDASAKDPGKHEDVKSLAQSKGIQVVFVLTGRCSSGSEVVYYQLAKETSGEVFHLDKKEIDKKMDGDENALGRVDPPLEKRSRSGSAQRSGRSDSTEKNQRMDIWLKKVNECATVYGWDERTTVHFAMQKLSGLAKTWYESLSSILFTWSEWQVKLLNAFPCEQNYGQMLEDMLKRRSRPNELIENYFYEKVALLNQCEITGRRAVDCIIHGITDRTMRSSALALRCEDPDQLLKFLLSNNKEIFTTQQIQKDRQVKLGEDRTNFKTNPRVNSNLYCYNCKEKGHPFSRCTKPLIKCSSCDKVGHKSERCREKQEPGSSKSNTVAKTMRISASNRDDKFFKDVSVEGLTLDAFLDLGSEVTLIKKSVFDKLGVDHDHVPTFMKGFGDGLVESLGSAKLNLAVDGVGAVVSCRVVEDHLLDKSMLVGQSYSEQPHIVVYKDFNKLQFMNIGNEVPDVNLDEEHLQRVRIVAHSKLFGVASVKAATETPLTGSIVLDTKVVGKPNEQYLKTIGRTPAEVMFGTVMNSEVNPILNEITAETREVSNLPSIRDEVKQKIDKAQELQKKYYDQGRRPARTYKKGDLIKVTKVTFQNDGKSTKLLPSYEGPFRVEKVLGNDRYKVAPIAGFEGQVTAILADCRLDLRAVLIYVQSQIDSRKEILLTKEYPSGTHEFDFEVDSKMKELVISVSGDDPVLAITGPDGVAPPTEESRTRTFVIVKVTEVKPGTYNARVTSSSKNSVKVTAETSVHFRHGFNTFRPTSVADTVTKPLPGEPSYISIKLESDGPVDVVLDKVQIMDLNYNVLQERILELVDRDKQFYIAKTTVVPPDHMFRVAVRGHDVKTGNKITRISLTPIELQKPVPPVNKIPTVTLIGDSKINAEYNESLVVKCKVSGYPKPKVIWQRSDGTKLESMLSLVELPYDYLSTLTIPRVTYNNTYYCVARNDNGGDSKQVQVETIRKVYYKLLQRPISNIIDINNEARFVCEVDASPPAFISWYKDKKIVLERRHVKISSNHSVLLIKHIQPRDEGKYYCEVIHERKVHRYHFDVYVSGTEVPVIDKTIREIRVTKGSDVKIPCKIIQGIPTPARHWAVVDLTGELNWLKTDSEYITLKSVLSYQKYRCEAHNELGTDYHIIDVILNSAPKIIVEGDTDKLANVNDNVFMDCEVEGEPEPIVKWFLNGTELAITGRYNPEYDGHGFKFIATEEDTGNYTCMAMNEFGTTNKTVELHIIRPATITPPDESRIGVNVGEHQKLECNVDGNPKPEVKWVFYSMNPKNAPMTFRPNGYNNQLLLKRIQIDDGGIYTCIARNVGGSSNITYEIDVFAPPNIENVYPEKTFTAVIGDLVLRIPCKATGNPKPDITWTVDGFNIAAGTEYNDIEDGTLVIKNVDKLSAGRYFCHARNRLGDDSEWYDVNVEAYPRPGIPTKTIRLQQGNSTTLTCDIPHKRTDYVRWFKNGRQVGSEMQKHHINNAQLRDAGIYTCRVSDFAKSRTGTLAVSVGYGPRFTLYSDDEEIIEFDERVAAVMDCSAEGNPKPEVSWWHDGNKIPFYDMTYIFNMKATNKGQYFCLVKNEYGSIRRKFTIVSRECWLNIQSDLKGNQPLMLTPDQKWPMFETSEGNLKIPSGETVRLHCPSGFKKFNTTDTYATCKQESFTVGGKPFKYSELECNKEVFLTTRATRKQCMIKDPSSKMIKIGYWAGPKFLEIYEVCLDMNSRVPHYAKHDIHYSLANVEPKAQNWPKIGAHLRKIDEMYDCGVQVDTISSVLRSWFHREDKCCFSKRPLVNARDVTPGLPQKSTYTVWNLVPHWSTCNTQNWDSVERKVRALTQVTNEALRVWTGVAGQLQIAGQNISIVDRKGQGQAVPKYLWKVVQDPSTKASLAIIQLNIPDLRLGEAYTHIFCRDICNEITWMKSRTWQDVGRGYTFCCAIKEFEKALGYRDVFGSGDGKVLYDVTDFLDRVEEF
ncbi:immunoglobulin i-set domain-containing protein [Phthorimaea operculella]|nr:immunoglobulin i-set domain-containing protein [Phthorimaea operculella]